jgi:hypothetical protein
MALRPFYTMPDPEDPVSVVSAHPQILFPLTNNILDPLQLL